MILLLLSPNPDIMFMDCIVSSSCNKKALGVSVSRLFFPRGGGRSIFVKAISNFEKRVSKEKRKGMEQRESEKGM